MKIIEYSDKYLEELKENEGKCFLAIENDKAIDFYTKGDYHSRCIDMIKKV